MESLTPGEVRSPEPSDDAPQNLCLDNSYDNRQSRRIVAVAHPWLNRFRKILVHFEKKAETHLGLLHFACAYIALNRAGTF